MFCPHCHNKIPDGSNICPLCYAGLMGVKGQQPQQPQVETAQEQKESAAPKKASSAKQGGKKAAYTKGSRGSKKKQDAAPVIIAFGLIVILVVIIVMIFRSMFGAGDVGVLGQKATAEPTSTPQQNFIVFGATPTPKPQAVVTATPALEITPTPAPQTVTYNYNTLRKNDQGQDVMMLQKALAELGYLNGAEDGIYGTGTQTAVKNFQKDHDLDADGIAGRMTLEALYGLVKITPIPETTVGPGDILDLPG